MPGRHPLEWALIDLLDASIRAEPAAADALSVITKREARSDVPAIDRLMADWPLAFGGLL